MSAAPERLQVGVNLAWLAPGRVGGSEEYLVRQLSAIAQGAGGDEIDLRLRLYAQHGFVEAHPALVSQIETVTMPGRRDLRGVRIAAEHSWLPLVSRDDDIVHHGGGTVPFWGKRASVMTLHDLQYLRFPQYFSRVRRTYLNAMVPRSVASATVVAVPSEYVRLRTMEEFDVDGDKVVVVPHGIEFGTAPTADEVAAVRRRYGVDRPYLIYPAITHPHKGHRRLIDMLAADTAGELSEYLLVLTGGEGAAEDEVRAAIVDAGLGDRVIRTGRVPSVDRDALIAGADAMVFPSEYEGFGAPIIEAMELGVPVVTSDHPAIVEVVGDAGVVVTEDDPNAWITAVRSAIDDSEQRVAAGIVRRDEYSLERSGRELGAAYRLAARLGGVGQ